MKTIAKQAEQPGTRMARGSIGPHQPTSRRLALDRARESDLGFSVSGPEANAQWELRQSIDKSPRQLAQDERLRGLFGPLYQRANDGLEAPMTSDLAPAKLPAQRLCEPAEGGCDVGRGVAKDSVAHPRGRFDSLAGDTTLGNVICPPPDISTATGQTLSRQTAAPVLQRKVYYVGKPNTAVFVGHVEDEGRKVATYERIRSLNLNTMVGAADDAEYQGVDATKAEYKKLSRPVDGVVGVVHQDNLRDSRKTRSGAWDVLETGAEFYEGGAGAYDLRAGSLDRGALRETDATGFKVDKQGNTETRAWAEKHGADVVSGSYETVANIINIAATLRQWKKRSKEERVSDLFDVAQTGTATAAAVTKVVDSSGKLDKGHRSGLGSEIEVQGGGRSSATESGGSYKTNQSDLAGKATGNIADFAGLVVDVKNIFFKGKELWETWKKRRDEETASRGDVARAAIDVGMTVATTIKDVVSTARNLLFTLENAWHAGLSSAVPGLGIAIGGLQLIVSIWKVVKANKQRAKMRNLKQEWKAKLDPSGKLNNKKIAAKKAEIEKRIERGQKVPGDEQKLAIIREYELQKELQTINRKRIDRQVLHISTDLTGIAGDIATLSGVGATAGVALKAAASGTELGAKGLRSVKQWGRDRASRESAWGLTKAVFNADKNTKAKRKQRDKFANMIYDMIINLADEADTFDQGVVPYEEKRFKRIRAYIRAAGLSWKVWLTKTSADPSEGHKAIMEAMAERE